MKLYSGFFVFCLLFMWISSHSREYYVSKNGNDKNPGTKSKPFLTIQKAASLMKAGDVCNISAGIYAETLAPPNSGTKESPIVFRAKDKTGVALTGSEPILHNKWEKVSANIFKTKVEMDLGHESQVFVNGKTMVEARHPNVGDDLLSPTLAAMNEGTTPDKIIDSELPDWDYTDAQLWIHAPKYWSDWTTKVLSFGKNTLTIENLAPYPGPSQHVAAPGADYFIFGIKEALDAENEWFYDKETRELFIFRTTGALPKEEYRVKRRMNAFDFSGKKHLEIQNITIIGSGIDTDESTEGIVLDGTHIFYPYYSSQCNKYFGDQKKKGIVLRGKNCTIKNSEIAYSSGVGVMMLGEKNKLINCYIHDTDFIGSYASCVSLAGKGNIVSHCTLTRSGRTVLDYGDMYQAIVQHCDMSHSGQITSDLGLSYGNVIEGGNSEVRYNVLHHNDDNHLDMGLYYDHGTQNIISHHNIVYGIRFSAFHINHYGAYHLAYNNTFISEKNGFRSTWGNKYSPDLLECRFANNLFSSPCETTAGNYHWMANIEGYEDFDENNIMQAAKEGLGKGVYLAGITAAPEGTKPGIGAIEYEGMTFKAGHDFENPPQNINLELSKPEYRNLIKNSAFEHENHLSPWKRNNNSVVPFEHPHQNHTKPDTTLIRMGNFGIELTQKGSELFQALGDLQAGEEYLFTGHLRVDRGEALVLGVRFSDGTEFTSPRVSYGAPNWRRSRLGFVVPENTSSVELFIRRLTGGKGKAYIDDFGLVIK